MNALADLALRVVVPLGGAIALAWLALLVLLSMARPRGLALGEALRLVPDSLRLLARLAGDRTLPSGVQVRLALALGYLAMPFDLVPDFIPVIGYADDVIIVCAVLRSVVRRAGPEAVRRHWPGTAEGLAELWRVAGLPGKA